jgi:hypothetical protein
VFIYTHFTLSQLNVNHKAKWNKGQGETCHILI